MSGEEPNFKKEKDKEQNGRGKIKWKSYLPSFIHYFFRDFCVIFSILPSPSCELNIADSKTEQKVKKWKNRKQIWVWEWIGINRWN